MSFLNGFFLTGLAAIAVPVILHLIQRQRYPERRFTTLRFFDVTIKHNVLQRRLIDRVLLALRVLALLALMAGLARPFWKGGVGEARLSLVIVLDNSPSMGRLRDNVALFDRARAAAGQWLAALGPSDRVAVVLTAPASDPEYVTDRAALLRTLDLRAGQPTGWLVQDPARRAAARPGLTTDTAALKAALARLPPGTPVALCGPGLTEPPALAYDHRPAAARLAQARVSLQPGRLRATLDAAAALLRGSHDGDRRIVVLSDLQASEWQTPGAARLDGLAVSICRVEAAAAEGPNLGIEACEVSERDAGLGQTVLGTATVRNYGTVASHEAKLAVTAGERGRPVDVKVPPLSPGTAVRLAFPVPVMARERNLLCRAALQSVDDPLAYDDTWYFQVGVRPPVAVLCVNGVPDATPAGRESFYVASALALPGASGRAETRVDVAECELEALDQQKLFQYRVVILAGVERLSAAARERLRQFVTDGGGLLVFPGRTATADEYNGWGFLPARVGERQTESFTYVQAVSETAPAVAGLPARLGAGVSTLTTRDWLTLEPGAGAEVLARFAGARAALVAGPLGRGCVMLAATSGHVSGSDWPLRPAFPILLHALVRALGAPATPLALEPERDAGASAARAVAPELVGGTPCVFRLGPEGGQTAYEALAWLRQGNALSLPAAQCPGQYLLAVRPGAAPGLLDEPGVGADVVPISVNHSRDESVLTPLKAGQAAALLPGAQVEETVVGSEGGGGRVAVPHTGRELWRALLVLALVALVVESLIGWRWASQSVG